MGFESAERGNYHSFAFSFFFFFFFFEKHFMTVGSYCLGWVLVSGEDMPEHLVARCCRTGDPRYELYLGHGLGLECVKVVPLYLRAPVGAFQD